MDELLNGMAKEIVKHPAIKAEIDRIAPELAKKLGKKVLEAAGSIYAEDLADTIFGPEVDKIISTAVKNAIAKEFGIETKSRKERA
jgi:hypothetical protein